MKEEATIAAKWWADILRRNNVDHDNGEPMQSAFADYVRDRTHPEGFDSEKIDEFERLLAKEIQKKINKREWDYDRPQFHTGPTFIGCDYGPHPILEKTAREAGLDINKTTFPFKTTMQVNPGQIWVSKGYKADRQFIHGSE